MFLDTAFLVNDEIQLCLEKTVAGDPEKDWLPAYHFIICRKSGQKIGDCDCGLATMQRPTTAAMSDIRYKKNTEGITTLEKHVFYCLNWPKSIAWII